MSIHANKLVRYRGMRARIDIGLADLILNIWKTGILTLNCCEDNVPQGWVWIQFFSASDAEEFLDTLVYERSDDTSSLYWRILHSWKYDVPIEDSSISPRRIFDPTNDVSEDLPAFLFSMEQARSLRVSIRFPRSDLPEVEKAIAFMAASLEKLCAHSPET